MPRTLAVVVLSLAACAARAGDPTYEDDVRPILKAMCYECHGEGEKLAGGLDLRLRRFLVKGGDKGPGIVPGKADESLLLKRVRDGQMPPGKKKLTAEQQDAIRRWVAAGAAVKNPEPESLNPGLFITPEDRAFWAFQPIRRPDVPKIAGGRTSIDAFILQKLQERKLTLSAEAEPRTLIRRATFDLIGLPPSPEEVEEFLKEHAANPETAYGKLIDRLLASPHYGERWGRHWLDVAGYADSEGYGEDDTVRPNAWRYRDYVIRSFNEDRPFDRFIQEQIAGDELIESRDKYTPADTDRLIATGFLRMAPDGTGQKNVEQKAARNQVITDTIRIVSTAFLGLTVQCAQCHHHRYDPIPQEDYYRLRALFEPAYNTDAWKPPTARDVSLLGAAELRQSRLIDAEANKFDAERIKLQRVQADEILKKIIEGVPEPKRDLARKAAATPVNRQTAEMKAIIKEHPDLALTQEVYARLDPDRSAKIKALSKQAADLRATKPTNVMVRGLTEAPGVIPVTRLFHRGDYDQPKQEIAPGALTILDDRFPLPSAPKHPTSGRRLAFAKWLTDPANPLVARVIVNRVWLNHFGRGLVATPADFGKLGERPTHPELLDHLASEFIRSGWSMKKLHRDIMLSAVYRQSSRLRISDPGSRIGNPKSEIADSQLVDPDNIYLSRMNVRRLEAEAVRDGILAVSGRLLDKTFGAPVPVKDTQEGQFILGIENKDPAGRFLAEIPLPAGEEYRRSVYVQVRRSKPYYVLDAFDAASVEPVCESRNSSTVTPQALLLMNSDFMLQQSLAFAERLEKDAGTDPTERVRRGWRLAFGRDPSAEQTAAAVAFIKAQTELLKKPLAAAPAPSGKSAVPLPTSPEQAALATWCQALLSANEFLYVD